MDVDSDVQSSTSAFANNAAEARPSHYVEGAIVPGGTPTCSSSADTRSSVVDFVSLNSYSEEAKMAVQRVNECKECISDLKRQGADLLLMPVNNKQELERRDFLLAKANSDTNYWSEQCIIATNLISSWEEASVSSLAANAKMLSLKEVPSVHVKDHNDIPARDIPRFNIKKSPLHRYETNNRNEKDTRPTLDEFIRNFERVYKSHRVDIKKHWFFHLESCFEKNDLDYSWFQQTIKVAYSEDGNSFT
jgi:hypothetical protein